MAATGGVSLRHHAARRHVTRSTATIAGVVLAVLASLAGSMSPSPARASQDGEWRHGLAAFDALKYPPEFTHFEYVNPDAPKGGRISMIGDGGRVTFDSFNGYILKGDAAQGLEFLFDTLMKRAYDEPDAMYGLVAEKAAVAADGLSVTFKLREAARFADGTPVTAEDVAFSFTALKEKGHPSYRIALADVVSAEAIDALTVRYTFQGSLIRDLPLTVAGLPIFSKAWYATRPFEETTLTPPLGSGPYRIADFKPGTFVSYVRREDYWAKDLPVNRGQHNFGEMRYEYYRDRTAELENLKNGTFDLREEFTSVDWATAYNIAAVTEGRLLRQNLPDERPSGAQGFFINLRKEKFKDPRVRKALDYAFDYEWTNNNLFYKLYLRTASFFENSDMKAVGPPSADELALLEPHRASLPPEVFGPAYTSPTSDGSGADRTLLREASRLLTEAGYTQQGGRRVDAKGEPLKIEFLLFSEAFVRIIGPYIENLKRLGIEADIRLVDPAQYERRVKSFDFDLTTQRYVMRLTPGAEMKGFWGSAAASTEGSFNLAGISHPAVDDLIDKAMAAKSRNELVTATRALDRVLRAGHYWVPHWYKASHNLAFWDKFSWPAVKPRYDRGVLETWWYDAAKAAKLERK
ncbi:MAG: extracellular solute-binding protein [Hyphomicrobiaceae bacterium]|nr:extracellular solute-binding protein [Hyphomicrobiaceae bacterium]